MKDPKAVRALIVANVSLADLLVEYGASLPQRLQPQQLSCPFHGRDLSMSARFYPETNSMYCFACKESWDPISFAMKTRGTKFMDTARFLAAKRGIDLSKVAELSGGNLFSFKSTGRISKANVDKKKMAQYAIEASLKACRDIEDPAVFGTMLYIVSGARHVEDPDKFAKIVMPVVKRLSSTLK